MDRRMHTIIVNLRRKLKGEKDTREKIAIEDEIAYLQDFASGFDGLVPMIEPERISEKKAVHKIIKEMINENEYMSVEGQGLPDKAVIDLGTDKQR